MQVVSGVLDELRGHLDAGKARYGLFSAEGSGQLYVGDVVEVELLDVADEVGYRCGHADLLLQVVQSTQVDATPLERLVLALDLR